MSSRSRYGELSDAEFRLLHEFCHRFERSLRSNVAVSIERAVNAAPQEVRAALFGELLAIELEFRETSESLPNIDEYLVRFPDDHDCVRQVFEEAAHLLDDLQRDSASPIRNPQDAMFGSMIGPYKLRELIGEGGMGLVYVAEQELPVRRQVALKIVKPGMDTKEVIARFESERQALAMMDHPHIANVLDAGATATGRPYFVMELIRGVPVTEYYNKHKLSMRCRLELFVKICHAVQHAHQKGIIHRDINSSNILVILHGDISVPKVIDFGVAKAVNQRLTERTFYTQMSQLVGTPMYMSPEQAERSSLAVDTRTDIYSLGVVLYEVLAGTTPFPRERLSQVGHDELRRIVNEEDPPGPSQRFSTLDAKTQSTISDQRSASQLRLGQMIRGELDWIVMKAMDKVVTRRYEMARDLAADVQHHLADEPVLARPTSVGYRLSKFARRNKIALTICVSPSLVDTARFERIQPRRPSWAKTNQESRNAFGVLLRMTSSEMQSISWW